MTIYETYSEHFDNKTIVTSITSIDESGNKLSIPLDPANSQYQRYLAQLEGKEPEFLGVADTTEISEAE